VPTTLFVSTYHRRSPSASNAVTTPSTRSVKTTPSGVAAGFVTVAAGLHAPDDLTAVGVDSEEVLGVRVHPAVADADTPSRSRRDEPRPLAVRSAESAESVATGHVDPAVVGGDITAETASPVEVVLVVFGHPPRAPVGRRRRVERQPTHDVERPPSRRGLSRIRSRQRIRSEEGSDPPIQPAPRPVTSTPSDRRVVRREIGRRDPSRPDRSVGRLGGVIPVLRRC
jgi:hypothetical protein